MMDDQKILDNAPEGSLIVDSKFRFFDGRYSELDKSGNWTWKKTMPSFPIRSLADIKELVELRKANAELEKNQIKWINCRAELPEYGVPVTVKAHGVVQNVTYTLSGAGEDFDVKLDWFEPFHFDHDDNCKIPLSNNVEWMLLPEAGN
jgi:hypothetical protein